MVKDGRVLHSKDFKKFVTPENVQFLELPEDIKILILSYLPFWDLCNCRHICESICNLIDSTATLWATAKLGEYWPNYSNYKYFLKASKHGNIEASIKLGMGYLYNAEVGAKTAKRLGELSSKFFHLADKSVKGPPFTWIFYRPPWFYTLCCVKVKVYEALKSYFFRGKYTHHSTVYGLGQLNLFIKDDDPNFLKSTITARFFFELGKGMGSPHATFKLLQMDYPDLTNLESSALLDYLRQLRSIVDHHPSCLEARLALCLAYAKGMAAPRDREMATDCLVSLFRDSATPAGQGDFRINVHLNNDVRFILINWIAEVAFDKDFGSPIFHMATDLIDRYLGENYTLKCRIQLVGIAALVASSRYVGENVLVVKEAAWLTDNTYTYMEVVKMMGHIAASLKGKLKVVTTFEYLGILSEALPPRQKSVRYLAEYLCDCSLVFAELRVHPRAVVAAACVVLSRIVHNETPVWTAKLQQISSFRLEDLTAAVIQLHEKCYPEQIEEEKLIIFKSHYGTAEKLNVHELKAPTCLEIYKILGYIPPRNRSENCDEMPSEPKDSEPKILNVAGSSKVSAIEDSSTSNHTGESGKSLLLEFNGDDLHENRRLSCDQCQMKVCDPKMNDLNDNDENHSGFCGCSGDRLPLASLNDAGNSKSANNNISNKKSNGKRKSSDQDDPIDCKCPKT